MLFNSVSPFNFRSEQNENLIYWQELTSNNTYQSELFKMAPSDYKCQKIVILGSRILAGCISTLDNNFQVCSLDFRLKTVSECQSFNLDYGLNADDDLSNEQVHFMAYSSPDNHDIFVFN